jgi:hypothetical protein
MIDVADMEKASAVAWVEKNAIKLANGDTYSFKDRPYLIKPLGSLARCKCVEKGTGLGYSETFILDTCHGCITGRYPQGAEYLFPNDTEMRTFVQSRYNPLLRDNKESIGKYVKNTDTTYYKRVGNSNLFFDGGRLSQVIEGQQKESAATRSKQFDHAVLDEFDLMDESLIQKVQGRMGNSKIKSMIVISNPTVENHKIDRLYKKSNQLHWFRRCSCGEFTCSDEEFPELISKKGCHCKKCGKVLGYRGEWVAKYSERNDLYGIGSTNWEGYQISQLNSTTNSPWVILQEYRDTDNIEDFWKLRMGRAYTPKENRLTSVEVYDCCGSYAMAETSRESTVMGVDVGKERYHYVIGIRTGRDKFEILKFGCAQSFADIGTIALRMNVRKCVVDIRPYEAEARRFQKEMKLPVYLCQYNENPLQDAVWDMDSRIVKAFRTGLFDITHRLAVEKRVRLPYRNSQTEEFAKQYCEPYKYKKEDLRSGSIIYHYDKGNGEDHYRNAMNYFYLAASSSRIIRPEKYGSTKANKARHETVKI